MGGITLRRLPSDRRGEHDQLLQLAAPEQLFVQTWMELFDRDVPVLLRLRPYSLADVAQEHSQVSSSSRLDYHLDLLVEELAARNGEPDMVRLSANPQALLSDPFAGAYRLASAASALGFDHEFLLHAFAVMLSMNDRPFIDRLQYLINWWLDNSEPRLFTVAFRAISGGRLAGGGQRLKWQELPEALRDATIGHRTWHTYQVENWQESLEFQQFKVYAPDFNTATAVALERYWNGRAALRARGHRAADLETEWALVDDPGQRPNPRTLIYRHKPFRYPVPERFRSGGPWGSLFAARAVDTELDQFLDHYMEAVVEIIDGRPEDAFDHLCKTLDLAAATPGRFSGLSRMGPPRKLVEHGATLLALDWCNLQFRVLANYLRVPAAVLGGKALIETERRPERIFDILADDVSWKDIIGRAPWDQLLQWRRNRLLTDLANLPNTLRRQRQVISWDLARAIRTRNQLFHEGRPLRAEHSLAILLTAIDHIVRLRVVSANEGLNIANLFLLAESDYRDLTTGSAGVDARRFAAFGWRGWRGRRGREF